MNGILMVAIGDQHQREAAQAVEQIRSVWPGVDVTVHTGDTGDPVRLQGIRAMRDSQYHHTLYLDTDTWLMEPVPELFDLMSNFDVALAHAPWRERYPVGVPDCFPEYNGGVMVYPYWLCHLFEDWEQRYMADMKSGLDPGHGTGFFPSQPALRYTLYHSGLRIATLPPEYNWRGDGYAHGPIKIIHSCQLKKLREEVNRNIGPRVCIGGEWHYAG